MSNKKISTELQAQIGRDRQAIEAELPELEEGHARMHEAKQENSICGELRRAIHRSGRLVREIATEAGIPSQQLVEFLEGGRTLRSDVLERILQAVSAEVTIVSQHKS